MDKRLPSDLDSGHAAIDDLMRALEAAGWEGRDLFHIQMSIEEAMVNAIEHGNKRNASKQVHVVFHVSSDRATMQITDEGSGFDHQNVADPTTEERQDQPRGRGVLLIRELMTETTYNASGNQINMTKVRSAAEPQSEDDAENSSEDNSDDHTDA